MKTKLVAATLLFCSLGILSSSGAQVESRIINGSPSGRDVPYVVSIYRQPEGFPYPFFTCTGTLLDSKHVLTAAHCIGDGIYSIGYNNRNLIWQERVEVTKKFVHPDFTDKELNGDVAIMVLAQPVELAWYPQLASGTILRRVRTRVRTRVKARLYGWGSIQPSGYKMPKDLQQATIPVLPQGKCEKDLEPYFNKATMICAGKISTDEIFNNGVDACAGDSGGPLLVRYRGKVRQIGVTSWGFGCANTIAAGVYVNLPVYADWIREQLTYE